VSTITFQSGYASTPTNYVALGNSYKSLSESGRMAAQQCTTMYISNAPVPVQRGDSNNIPYVDVIAASASGTTQSIQNAVLFAGNNPYNPATRFSQYRFANTVIPPPPPCPVAVPNPGAIIGICSPPLMFRGSVENVGPT
jgi:Flp pilus assembly protein TadG